MLLLLCLSPVLFSQTNGVSPLTGADQFTATLLEGSLDTDSPRLVATTDRLQRLRRLIQTDTTVAGYYGAVHARADRLLDEPPLTRLMEGRRLLAVSREAVRRISLLALVHLVDNERRHLDRLERELLAVSAFTDWNPGHFLDVAEMMLAVSIGLDWTGDALPLSTRSTVRSALYRHGLAPSMAQEHGWISNTNNWNQVCHGGTIAAALILADEYPDVSARAIARALRGLPHALSVYGPDGAYPEGPSYWTYGTGYSLVGLEMLRTALGQDFGLATYPGFQESARFRIAVRAPSGLYYNYSDSRANGGSEGAEFLAWFALEQGAPEYLELQSLTDVYARGSEGPRSAAIALLWVAEAVATLPLTEADPVLDWSAAGPNPLFTLRDADELSFYLAGKGGRGSLNHGNMDAGSFIFELDGVRWAIDPGNQSYFALENIGFPLWGRTQGADRWKLLSKNSYFHNGLTVNDSLHRVNGFAPVSKTGPGSYSVRLDDVHAGQLAAATRTFEKTGPRSFVITDSLQVDSSTQVVSWQWLTQAEVTLTAGGARLVHGDKSLDLTVESPADVAFSVLQFDPPPLPYDLRLPGLKRLELRIPAYVLESDPLIRVRVGDQSAAIRR